MPQFDQILATYSSQIFWMLIVFGLIFFTVGYGMLPKIEANVDARDRKIAADLAAAQKARDEADGLSSGTDAELTTARAAAQAKAAEAKTKASKDTEARMAKAKADVDAKLAAAEMDLSKAKAKAMDSIESLAAEAAADIVAKVSGAAVTKPQAASAVKAALSNV